MYSALKKIVKSVLPASIIKRNEQSIRRVFSFAYRGKEYKCNICSFEMKRFVTLENGNKLCPKCGSLPRNRRLWQLIEDKLEGKAILHFSPSKSISTKIRVSNTKKYITTDFENEFDAEKQYDIQSIDEKDNTYNLIICFHILEHIPNDKKALGELFRILKNNGEVYIQTPFKNGETYEDDTIVKPKDRLEHFGQEDHLRIYSVVGLTKRLEDVGFSVERLQFNEEKNNYNGFSIEETVLVARKK